MSSKKNYQKKSSNKKFTRTRQEKPHFIEDEEKDINFESIPMSKKSLSDIENSYRQILEMQGKILSAPAMNGGFTTLLYKVEKIEQNQTQIVEKVDQIHDVLYEPDNGLYARIKKVENSSISDEKVEEIEKNVEEIEKDVQEIKIWKSSTEKTSEKDEVKDDEKTKLLLQHENSIISLQNSIKKYNAIAKWLTVSVGGGLLSLLGKLIYDYIAGHIKFV